MVANNRMHVNNSQQFVRHDRTFDSRKTCTIVIRRNRGSYAEALDFPPLSRSAAHKLACKLDLLLAACAYGVPLRRFTQPVEDAIQFAATATALGHQYWLEVVDGELTSGETPPWQIVYSTQHLHGD
jgi:hypothetical protein